MRLATPAGFAARRPHDGAVWAAMLGLYWLVMIMGFGPESLARLQRPEGLGYPWIVHLHAAAFVGWMTLLTVQMGLVQSGRIALHRRLGRLGLGLMLAMLVLGPAAMIRTTRPGAGFGEPGDPAVIMLAFPALALFGLLTGLALWLRHDAAAHRRLMLLGSFAMLEAGSGRWLYAPFTAALGTSYPVSLLASEGFTYLLVLGMAVHDRVTRGRLHPATLVGGSLVIAVTLVAEYLYLTPWWHAVARGLFAG